MVSRRNNRLVAKRKEHAVLSPRQSEEETRLILNVLGYPHIGYAVEYWSKTTRHGDKNGQNDLPTSEQDT